VIFSSLTFFALFVALIFCLVRAFVEIRDRRYYWASAAFVGVLGICAAPFPKQVINIYLD
jgi:hypothetical protein